MLESAAAITDRGCRSMEGPLSWETKSRGIARGTQGASLRVGGAAAWHGHASRWWSHARRRTGIPRKLARRSPRARESSPAAQSLPSRHGGAYPADREKTVGPRSLAFAALIVGLVLVVVVSVRRSGTGERLGPTPATAVQTQE